MVTLGYSEKLWFLNVHINFKIHFSIIDKNMELRAAIPHGQLSRQNIWGYDWNNLLFAESQQCGVLTISQNS
jgi:hypothetical protein